MAVDPAYDQYPNLSPYVYCADNPLEYTDPSGTFLETLWDIGSAVLSGIDLIKEPSWTNFGWFALDVGAAVVPFLPGGFGIVKKGKQAVDITGDVLSKTDDVVEAGSKLSKNIPNPYGRAGGPPHQRGVDEAFKEARAKYPNEMIKKEGKLNTPGGQKNTRYGDVVVYNKNQKPIEVYQVGDFTKNGIPVKRERDAAKDILRYYGVPVNYRVKIYK